MRALICSALALALLVVAPQRAAAACAVDPPAVTNNQWPNTCRNLSSGVCTGVCNDGYELGGPPTSTCQGNTWTTPVGTCIKACTGDPPGLQGVDWSACAGGVQVGKRCSGKCTGTLSGSPSIGCANNGWDVNSISGRCLASGCAGLPPQRVINGEWPASCIDSPAGSVCTATCRSGYGPGASAACVGGTWAAPTGMCARVCPDTPPAVTGVTWPASCAGTTPVGQRCNGTCPSGSSGKPSILCAGGAWLPTTVVGRCVNGPSCSTLPPTTVNGVWPQSCLDTAATQTCTATCRTGYGPGSSATCNADGSWTVTGECRRVCADVPVTPSQPGVNWAACVNTRVGRKCVGTCPTGQSGTPTIMCTGSSGWVAASLVGQCVTGQVCQPPYPALLNAKWPDSCLNTAPGQTCTPQCNTGYGPGATVKCGSAGAWEAVVGSCNKVCLDAPPAMTDIDWAGCAGVTRYGRRCAGKCLNGKNGSPSIACSGGAWSVESMIGKCVTGPVCTAPFPALVNGAWPNSCFDSAVGSTCTAVCNNGYATPGATTTCTGTGWAAVVGKCGRNP